LLRFCLNVVQYCSLACLANKKHEINVEMLQAGIEREYQKEGKVF
jgi:hypothetical protein